MTDPAEPAPTLLPSRPPAAQSEPVAGTIVYGGPTPPADPAREPGTLVYHGPVPTAGAADAGAGVSIPGYEILAVLGRGGMGVVYKARQTGLNRVVALKMILAGAHAGPADRARFRQEAEAVAALRHPNIVGVYDVGEHDETPYFSIEYVEGGTLARLLGGRPQPPRFAAEVIEILARAIQTAHAKNIIHRDLKPANVLLGAATNGDTTAGTLVAFRPADRLAAPGDAGRTVVPKITDFGLAKRLDGGVDLTVTGGLAGTPQYMAPEQVAGDRARLGPGVDIHALGAIFYEMLTGVAPFAADGPVEAMNRVVRDLPASPRTLQPKTPRDLATVCLKCLEKDPAKRYPTAADLADDLRRFLQGEPIHARAVSSTERAWRWTRRNPGVAAGLAGFVFTLVAGATAAGSFAVLAERHAEAARDEAERADRNAHAAARNAEDARAAERQAAAAAAAAKENEARAREAERAEAKLLADRERLLAEETRLTAEAVTRERVRDRELYDARMTQAQRAWDDGNLPRFGALLGRYVPAGPSDPDPRGFEWYYLDSVRFSARAEVLGLSPGPAAVAASADGKVVAWAGGDEVRVFAGADGPPRPFQLTGHDGPVSAVAVTPDGRAVATSGADSTVRLWDAATGKQFWVARTKRGPALGLAFRPDGAVLAAACGASRPTARDGACLLMDPGTGAVRRELTAGGHRFAAVVFPPAGPTVLTADPTYGLVEWDVPSGRQVRADPAASLNRLAAVAVSPRGDRVCVGHTTGGRVDVLRADTWELVRGLSGAFGAVRAVAVAADGATVAAGDGAGAVRLWAAESGEPVNLLRGHPEPVTGLAFAGPNVVLSASADGRRLVWDAADRQDYRTLATGAWAAADAFPLPDGRRAAVVAGAGRVGVFDLSTGRGEWGPYTPTGPAGGCGLGPGGDAVYVLTPGQGLNTVSLADGTARPVRLPGLAPEPVGIALSADGRRVVTAHAAGPVQVHAAGADKPVSLAGAAGPAAGLAVRPDGGQVAAAVRGAVRAWDAGTGEQVWAVPLPASLGVKLAYSADGTRLAVVGTPDGVVRVWDARTGAGVRELEGHGEPAVAAAFSPAGDRLATGGADRTIKLWDLSTGFEAISVRTPDGIPGGLRFAPNGDGLLAVVDGRVRFLDARTGATRELYRVARRDLRVREVSAPAAVRAGEPVRIGFAITNPSGRDFRLPPAAARVVTPELTIRVTAGRDGAAPVSEKDEPVEVGADIPAGGRLAATITIPTAGWVPGRYRVRVVQPGGPAEPGVEVEVR